MTTWNRNATILTLHLGMIGCSGAGDRSQPDVVRTDSAGIEIVSSSDQDRSLSWSIERILQLGGADTGPESFYQIRSDGLAIDSAGRIYVLDAGNHRVQVFERDGSHVRTIGSEGGGPGELQFPFALALSGSNDLIVTDFGHGAAIRFDSLGNYQGQVRLPRWLFGRIHIGPAGTIYGTRHEDEKTGRVTFVLHSATERDTSRLAALDLPAARQLTYQSCGVRISLPPVFADVPRWNASSGVTALISPPDYEVRVFSAAGERIIRRSISAQRATVQHALDDLGEGERWVIGNRPCVVPSTEVVEQRGVAPSIPVLSNIAVWPDGSIWTRRKVIAAETAPIDVFDESGGYVGTLPVETPWPAATGRDGLFLTIDQDEMDIPYITLHRIDRDERQRGRP